MWMNCTELERQIIFVHWLFFIFTYFHWFLMKIFLSIILISIVAEPQHSYDLVIGEKHLVLTDAHYYV